MRLWFIRDLAANFQGTEPSTTRLMSMCNHSADEYVRTGGFHHTNTVESFFALLKRAVYGQFHHISEAHLHRYLAEADFKYNHRIALGIDDTERAEALLRGAKGKRLYYRQPSEAPNA